MIVSETPTLFPTPPIDDATLSIGAAIEAIRYSALTERDKGEQFENLVKAVLPTLPEYEMRSVQRFADWSTSRSGERRDLGIDLVGELNSGGLVAIQCKLWKEDRRLSLKDIEGFLSASAAQREGKRIFEHPMLIATCGINHNAEAHLRLHEGKYIPFYYKHRTDPINYEKTRKPHDPLPLQQEAIDACVHGLVHHARGRLVMACGTGKTFTALKVAESMLARTILFVAPSIALVGQARKEWLRQSLRPMDTLIVCSDSTAGQSSDEESGLLELNCRVTRTPSVIRQFLEPNDRIKVIFCTHQSLRRITESQQEGISTPFDLVVIDEAHWTTGVGRQQASEKFSFQDVHSDQYVKAAKRLYMTATPRVYTARSKQRMQNQGFVVYDMEDTDIFGPELYRMSFRKAMESPGMDGQPMLCDYRVVVLAIPDQRVTEEMRRRLENLEESSASAVRKTGLENHITRVYGTSLAINGHIQGDSHELPDRLRRVICYCNTIATSKWYARALMDPKVKERTTRIMDDSSKVGALRAEHLDAKHKAFERLQALDRLREVSGDVPVSEILCNVRLFSEGVDVPSLDAVVFLEPRKSQVDVVQAVGRVMRRGKADKKLGYVVVPVVVPTGPATLEKIEQDESGFQIIGQVLRALQSHDGRLAEEVAQRVLLAVPDLQVPNDGDGTENIDNQNLTQADLFGGSAHSLADCLMVRIVEASGLGSAGQLNAYDIMQAVQLAGDQFHHAGAAESLAPVVGTSFTTDGKEARNICRIAALLVANACLLHKRLSGIERLDLRGLEGFGAEDQPIQVLQVEWEKILQRDYEPIFQPALSVLHALPDEQNCHTGLYRLVSCANAVADSLSEMGYDHAGPLYHRILDTAESEGAFYTKNMAALLLARLALSPDFTNWTQKGATDLRVIDPACGTGTLLMASLKTLKERVEAQTPEVDVADLHKYLVENTIYGLDINRQAIQLAASNMTLGGLSVDFERMNVYSMPHGFDRQGHVLGAGSLELLLGEEIPITGTGTRTLQQAGSQQVVGAAQDIDPKNAFDLVIMNPPFTNNTKRGGQWNKSQKKEMQDYEKMVSEEVEVRQGESAQRLIDYNSIRTFFTPLADLLVKKKQGTLAKVMPVTACTSASGLSERQFLAKRFRIEMLITCHAGRRFSFSGNTDIHECLMVARRHEGPPPPPLKSLCYIVIRNVKMK